MIPDAALAAAAVNHKGRECIIPKSAVQKINAQYAPGGTLILPAGSLPLSESLAADLNQAGIAVKRRGRHRATKCPIKHLRLIEGRYLPMVVPGVWPAGSVESQWSAAIEDIRRSL